MKGHIFVDTVYAQSAKVLEKMIEESLKDGDQLISVVDIGMYNFYLIIERNVSKPQITLNRHDSVNKLM